MPSGEGECEGVDGVVGEFRLVRRGREKLNPRPPVLAVTRDGARFVIVAVELEVGNVDDDGEGFVEDRDGNEGEGVVDDVDEEGCDLDLDCEVDCENDVDVDA